MTDKWDEYNWLAKALQRSWLRRQDNWDLLFALRAADDQQERFLRANRDIEQLLFKWEYLTGPATPTGVQNQAAAVR